MSTDEEKKVREAKAKKAAYDKQRYQDNKEEILEQCAQYRQDNPEYRKQYYQDNKERELEQQAQYYQDNREELLEKQSQHYQDNKPSYFARSAKRRALKLKACLPSSCMKAIQLFYVSAQKISTILGIQMHVDHIHPLCKGGAHHQDNLQVITACENLSKGSSWDGVSGKGKDD